MAVPDWALLASPYRGLTGSPYRSQEVRPTNSCANKSTVARRSPSPARSQHSLARIRKELLFFALEMKSRAIQERNPAIRFLYWLYESTSDFGQSVKRPLLWLLGLIVLSTAIYALIFDFPTILACVNQPACILVVKPERLRAVFSLTLHPSLPFFWLLKESASTGAELLAGKGNAIPVLAQLWAVFHGIASIVPVFLVAL